MARHSIDAEEHKSKSRDTAEILHCTIRSVDTRHSFIYIFVSLFPPLLKS